MALQTINPISIGKELIEICGVDLSYQAGTIDAAGEYQSGVFKATKTGTISKVAIRVVAVTTADVIAVQVETVSATTGLPSGIYYNSATACTFQDTGDTVTKNGHGLANGDPIQFATIVTTTGISTNTTYYVTGQSANTFQVESTVGGGALALTNNGTGTYTAGGQIPAPSANTTYWVGLNGAVGIPVTIGDIICVKVFIEYVDGNLTVGVRTGNVTLHGFPYCCTSTGTPGKSSGSPNIGVEYSDGIVRLPGMIPALALATYTAYGNNDAPIRRGLCFQVPYNCRIIGCWIQGAQYVADCNVVLYDSDQATALETIARDKDIGTAVTNEIVYVTFGAGHVLIPNTNYRIAVEPTSTTDIRFYYVDLTDDGAEAATKALEGGATWQYTSNNTDPPTQESHWDNDSDRRPMIAIEIDQLDDGYGFPHFGDMSGGKY